jgi:hypothetical protein
MPEPTPPGPPRVARPAPESLVTGRGRFARTFLPDPVSARHGLAVAILGFVVEGGTEAYQFLERASLSQGWLEYYSTLGTTLLGFYLMFLGFREWHKFYPKPVRRHRIPWLLWQLLANAFLTMGLWAGRHFRGWRRKNLFAWTIAMASAAALVIVTSIMIERESRVPRKRRWPWFAVALWGGGTAAAAILDLLRPGAAGGSAPEWIAWPVAGLVVLAFGRFFFDLRRIAQPFASRAGHAAGWSAFVWALGVGVAAGLGIGARSVLLLTEFLSNWGALIASVAPLVVAIAPLFVAYGLVTAAYWPVFRAVSEPLGPSPRGGPRAPSGNLGRGSSPVLPRHG